MDEILDEELGEAEDGGEDDEDDNADDDDDPYDEDDVREPVFGHGRVFATLFNRFRAA